MPWSSDGDAGKGRKTTPKPVSKQRQLQPLVATRPSRPIHFDRGLQSRIPSACNANRSESRLLNGVQRGRGQCIRMNNRTCEHRIPFCIANEASKDTGNRDHTGNARGGRDVRRGADAGTAANSGGGADAKILSRRNGVAIQLQLWVSVSLGLCNCCHNSWLRTAL